MNAGEWFGLIIFALVGLGLVSLSIPLLMGKATWLISGYNTMTAEEKSQYDGPALARFTGRVLLVCGLVTLPYGVGLFHFGWAWLTWIYLVVVVGLSIFAVVYCNTGKRFKK